MADFLLFLAALLCAFLLGVWAGSPSEAALKARQEAREAKAACERPLPRTQVCRMVYVPVPPK